MLATMGIIRLLSAALLLASTAAVAEAPLRDTLVALAPGVDGNVVALALAARECAGERGVSTGERLAVIDYSRPSTEPRLWVFDLNKPSLLFFEHVAHGRDSGANFAQSFSNGDGSRQTSLGLFRTAETYIGHNGYSLRLDGLEAGINDHARARAIVMHGAAYVDPLQARRQGRLGRSFGCPALRPVVAKPLIDSIREGQLLFAWYPQPSWTQTSPLMACAARHLQADAKTTRHDGAPMR